jgi:hypothetical protein
MFRAKPIALREGYSAFLAAIVKDVLAFEFDPFVNEFIEEHPKFNTFIDTVYNKYLEESRSTIPHPNAQ